MSRPRLRTTLILAAASLALGGCGTYFGNGIGVGVGYGGYGGYGDPYGYGGYGGYDPYYSGYGYGNPYGYGYGYGYPSYYGWHDGFYYPGRGYYVYDSSGRRLTWSEQQRKFWESRGAGVTVQNRTENWSGYTTQQTSGVSSTSDAGSRIRQWQRSGGDRRGLRVRNDGIRSQAVQVQGTESRGDFARAQSSAREERRIERQAARVERQAERAERARPSRSDSSSEQPE